MACFMAPSFPIFVHGGAPRERRSLGKIDRDLCFFVVVYRRMFKDYRNHMEDGNCRFVVRYFVCSPLIISIQMDFFEKNGLD